MTFRGEGLATAAPNPNDISVDYPLTYYQRSQKYELPSVLNIGGSYDFVINPRHKITVLGNFTSNSFSQDQIGAGLEYAFNNLVILRGAYKYEFGSNENDSVEAPIYTGISAGLSVMVPLKKETDNVFGIDYAYRTTRLWNGTHNISLRFAF